MKVVDDFLDDESLKLIQEEILTQAWDYCPYVVQEGDDQEMFCVIFE